MTEKDVLVTCDWAMKFLPRKYREGELLVDTVMCLSIGTPKIINFPFGTNGKLIILGVPIFKHIRVYNFVLLKR